MNHMCICIPVTKFCGIVLIMFKCCFNSYNCHTIRKNVKLSPVEYSQYTVVTSKKFDIL